MATFFASGHVVDVILAVMAVEALLLLRLQSGASVGDVLCVLLPGALLLLALRGALVGAGWMWIALCLLLAFPAHLIDLRRRWGRAPRR